MEPGLLVVISPVAIKKDEFALFPGIVALREV